MKKLCLILCGGLLLAATARAQPVAASNGRAARFPAQVGDIAFDPQLDRADFYLCDSSRIYQYYQAGTALEGEHRAVLDYFRKNFRPDPADRGENGYLVVRFVVNCRGETDRFRMTGLGFDYQPRSFRPALAAQLLRLTRELQGWAQGPKSGFANTYVFLNFIIKDGQLADVGP